MYFKQILNIFYYSGSHIERLNPPPFCFKHDLNQDTLTTQVGRTGGQNSRQKIAANGSFAAIQGHTTNSNFRREFRLFNR